MRKLIRLSLEIHNTLQIYIFFPYVVPHLPIFIHVCPLIVYKSAAPLANRLTSGARSLCCKNRQSPQPSPAPMSSYRQVKTLRLRWLCCNIVAANIQPPSNPRPHVFLPPSENAKTSLAMLQHCCSQYPATPPSPAPMSSYRQEAVIAVGVDFMSIRSPIRVNV